MKNKTLIYGSMVALQALIYGMGNAVTKIAYESITPFWSMVLRFGLAFVVFLIFFGKGIFKQLKDVSLMTWLPSSLCVAATFITCNVALDMTTATNVGFFISLSVLFVPLMETIILKRKFRLKYLPAQFMVIVGLYFLCCNGGSFSIGWGEALALLSSVAMAGSLVFGEKGLQDMNAMTISTMQVGITFGASLIGALVLEPNFHMTSVEPSAWMVLFYLAVISTCLAFWLQNKALTGITSTQVSVILCSEPVFTAAISWVILGEILSGIGLLGTVIIVGCIVAETWVISTVNGQPVPEEVCEAIKPAFREEEAV